MSSNVATPPLAHAPNEKDRARYRAFQIVYAILVANFALPVVSYIARRELAVATLDDVNRLLGGGAYPFQEDGGQLWHMLGVGNVATLAFMCALLLIDLRRFYPILPALAFLKGFSAVYSFAISANTGAPAFAAIGVLDGVTTIAMVFFARRAYRALPPPPLPPPPTNSSAERWWMRVLLLHPSRIEKRLAVIEERGMIAPSATPSLSQVFRGVMRMQHRLLFRTETVGTCRERPVRRTWRARLLSIRAIRLPCLLWERAVAPLDLSGMVSSRERIIRHLLAAHHDDRELAYDLELLELHPQGIEMLCEAARRVVVDEPTTARSLWLRDLVVFERYHEVLLDAAESARRGDKILPPALRDDPDVSFRAFLTWCAQT